MYMIINIPEEFERHFLNDRFKDSLLRLKTDTHQIAGNYERELCDMLIDSFKKAQRIYIDNKPKYIVKEW